MGKLINPTKKEKTCVKQVVYSCFGGQKLFFEKFTKQKKRLDVIRKARIQFSIIRNVRRETDKLLAFNEKEILQIMNKQIPYDNGIHKHYTLGLRIKAVNLMATRHRIYFMH